MKKYRIPAGLLFCICLLSGCISVEKLSEKTLVQKSAMVAPGTAYVIVEPQYAASYSRTEHQAYTTHEKPVFTETGRGVYEKTHKYFNSAIQENLAMHRMTENREAHSLIVKYEMDWRSIDYYGSKRTRATVNLIVSDSETSELYYFRTGTFVLNESLDLRAARLIVEELLSGFEPGKS